MQPDINTIIIPEGYHIEFSEDNKVARIVKDEEKHQGARTWEEYCEKKGVCPVWTIDAIAPHEQSGLTYRGIMGSEYFNSKEECRAFDALKELLLLYKDWIGEWKPTYSDHTACEYGSIVYNHHVDAVEVTRPSSYGKLFTFPSIGMAKDFVKCFHPLIELSKILL